MIDSYQRVDEMPTRLHSLPVLSWLGVKPLALEVGWASFWILAVLLFGQFPPLSLVAWQLRLVILPVALTYVSARVEMDGLPIHRVLVGMVRGGFRSRPLAGGYRPVERKSVTWQPRPVRRRYPVRVLAFGSIVGVTVILLALVGLSDRSVPVVRLVRPALVPSLLPAVVQPAVTPARIAPKAKQRRVRRVARRPAVERAARRALRPVAPVRAPTVAVTPRVVAPPVAPRVSSRVTGSAPVAVRSSGGGAAVCYPGVPGC